MLVGENTIKGGNFERMYYLGVTLIVLFVIVEVALFVGILTHRSNIEKSYRKESEKELNLVPFKHSGTFYSLLFLPIELETTNSAVTTYIRRHNKLLGLYYLNLVTLIAGIIVLNQS